MLNVVNKINQFLEIVTMILHQNEVGVSELLLFDWFFFQIQADALVFFILLALDTFNDSTNVLHDVDNVPNNFITVIIKDIKFSIVYNEKAFDKLLPLQKIDLLWI